MKKRISAALAATILLTGCSWKDFWTVSREEVKNSEPVEEITTEPQTEILSEAALQSGGRNASPVVDRHTRYIDLTRQKNREYWKRDSHESRYRMRGHGTIIEGNGNIRLRDSEGKEKILVSSDKIGGRPEIDCKIDESRFVFTVYDGDPVVIYDGDPAVKCMIYDLETESYTDISAEYDFLSYPYHRPYVSGNNLILRMKDADSDGDFSYLLVDLDTYKISKAEYGDINHESDYSWAAFSPDGKDVAVISGGDESNGLYEYKVTLYSQKNGEKLSEFVIGAETKHPEFSLEFKDNNLIYVYAAGDDVTGWSDLYIIDLWYGDGIEYIQNKKKEYPAAENVVIAEPEETDLMNRPSPLIIFGDEGNYYYNYYYDSGDGNLVAFCAGSACSWSFVRDGVLYGTTYQYNGSVGDVVAYACKYENNEISIISEASDEGSACVYTPDYIYYVLERGESKGIYRMDYDGKNHKRVFAFDDSVFMGDFIVNGSKIYYSWYESDMDMQLYRFGIYDMETKEHKRLNDGEVGRINGGYMYYTIYGNYEDNSGIIYNLMRMNLEDYTIECVGEDVLRYDFQGNSILYYRNESFGKSNIYRLENGESKVVFSSDTLGEECFIYEMQCTEDEIILNAEIDAYHVQLIGIDKHGNIKKYHEYGEWNAPPAY